MKDLKTEMLSAQNLLDNIEKIVVDDDKNQLVIKDANMPHYLAQFVDLKLLNFKVQAKLHAKTQQTLKTKSMAEIKQEKISAFEYYRQFVDRACAACSSDVDGAEYADLIEPESYRQPSQKIDSIESRLELLKKLEHEIEVRNE